MEDEKLWWILEFALRDLSLPHALLLSILHSLPFPSKPQPQPPPAHIQRLLVLRSLLSSISSHVPPSPTTLLSLERLLPHPRTSPPSPALCNAYSSVLFYLSTVPGFAAEIAAALARVGEYGYAAELLQPWRAMIARQEKIGGSPGDRVVSARDRAVFDLRGFVDGEFRAMEPPFLERCCVQELRAENQKVATPEPSKRSDKGVAQAEPEANLIEKSPIRTDTKQDDGTYTPNRRSERVATPNKTQGNERETLLKTGAKGVEGDSAPIRRSDKIVNRKETRTHGAETSPTNNEVNQEDYISNRQNNISKENQPSPTKSCIANREKNKGKETEKNTDGATTSHANGTNVETNNRVSRGPAHSFMDRNPTAHVFEWNDSIDDSPEKEKACTTSIPKKRAWESEGQKGHIPKRRQKCRWQPYEEDALRKAVLEFGKGNWKEILDNYPNEFSGRNAVDLKDKWRNMTRY